MGEGIKSYWEPPACLNPIVDTMWVVAGTLLGRIEPLISLTHLYQQLSFKSTVIFSLVSNQSVTTY